MYDYQQNYTRKAFKREKRTYAKLVAQWEALLVACNEGVFEVTVRSQSGAITIPVSLPDGLELTSLLVENFGKQIAQLERNLNDTARELGREVEGEMKKEAAGLVRREADAKQAQAEYAEQCLVLALQAEAGADALARERAANSAAQAATANDGEGRNA